MSASFLCVSNDWLQTVQVFVNMVVSFRWIDYQREESLPLFRFRRRAKVGRPSLTLIAQTGQAKYYLYYTPLLTFVKVGCKLAGRLGVGKMRLTKERVEGLTKAVRVGHRETCARGGCDCVTQEEHERMLGGKEFDSTFPNPYNDNPFEL